VAAWSAGVIAAAIATVAVGYFIVPAVALWMLYLAVCVSLYAA